MWYASGLQLSTLTRLCVALLYNLLRFPHFPFFIATSPALRQHQLIIQSLQQPLANLASPSLLSSRLTNDTTRCATVTYISHFSSPVSILSLVSKWANCQYRSLSNTPASSSVPKRTRVARLVVIIIRRRLATAFDSASLPVSGVRLALVAYSCVAPGASLVLAFAFPATIAKR